MRPDASVSFRPVSPALATLLALLLPALSPTEARAQDADATALPSTPEGAVERLFDAMRNADSARARQLFHPEATLARPVERDSGVVLQRVAVNRFLETIGSAEPGSLDEKIGPIRVLVDGPLAVAWMEYVFYLNGELHHCGVNAFQLYRAETGWKIFGIADTSRTDGCSVPGPRREEPGP